MALPLEVVLANNLWVIICGLLVFTMTISVGFLEVGELGTDLEVSLLKTLLITGSALFFMAFIGFNTAFAPTINGIIGNPGYNGFFLGGFASDASGLLTGAWWSTTGQGLTTGTYFLFETAFASVTLALVGVVVLRKMKLEAFFAYSIVYFILIWNLPAAWIWNPQGWLARMGMADFAGGLVVHGAAAAAGLAIVLQIWREERKRGRYESVVVAYKQNSGWLTLSILLLWVGWFGFNPGSVLAFNNSAMTVVLTTFLAAASSFLSIMFFRYRMIKKMPDLIYGTNGVLMGLIIITPLAGFVSPGSAVILGLIGGPLYLVGEKWFSRFKWLSDPVGLFPGHLLGGLFGVLMIAFFSQRSFAVAAGNPVAPNISPIPDGLLFGGGSAAVQQLGVEALGVGAVMATIFLLSYVSVRIISI
ncbi:MAG TPA: ammonium transporter, partial [Candidatus Bathyarchaeia archaeon]|nr:ammonium transporter [Candidatus Bathyarchaeia archaeon]